MTLLFVCLLSGDVQCRLCLVPNRAVLLFEAKENPMSKTSGFECSTNAAKA